MQNLVHEIVQKIVQGSNGPMVQWSSPYFILCDSTHLLQFLLRLIKAFTIYLIKRVLHYYSFHLFS